MELIDSVFKYLGTNPDRFFAYTSIVAAVGLTLVQDYCDIRQAKMLKRKAVDVQLCNAVLRRDNLNDRF